VVACAFCVCVWGGELRWLGLVGEGVCVGQGRVVCVAHSGLQASQRQRPKAEVRTAASRAEPPPSPAQAPEPPPRRSSGA